MLHIKNFHKFKFIAYCYGFRYDIVIPTISHDTADDNSVDSDSDLATSGSQSDREDHASNVFLDIDKCYKTPSRNQLSPATSMDFVHFMSNVPTPYSIPSTVQFPSLTKSGSASKEKSTRHCVRKNRNRANTIHRSLDVHVDASDLRDIQTPHRRASWSYNNTEERASETSDSKQDTNVQLLCTYPQPGAVSGSSADSSKRRLTPTGRSQARLPWHLRKMSQEEESDLVSGELRLSAADLREQLYRENSTDYELLNDELRRCRYLRLGSGTDEVD